MPEQAVCLPPAVPRKEDVGAQVYVATTALHALPKQSRIVSPPYHQHTYATGQTLTSTSLLSRTPPVSFASFPTSLMFQNVDGAWAGGRGFKKQPYLTVIDGGGGTVTGDTTTMVTASVTPSLMVNTA